MEQTLEQAIQELKQATEEYLKATQSQQACYKDNTGALNKTFYSCEAINAYYDFLKKNCRNWITAFDAFEAGAEWQKGKDAAEQVLNEIKEWANSSHSYLSTRTYYARGYKHGITQAKEIVKDYLSKLEMGNN